MIRLTQRDGQDAYFSVAHIQVVTPAPFGSVVYSIGAHSEVKETPAQIARLVKNDQKREERKSGLRLVS